MLADKNVAATLAVKDIDVAKKFYTDTLGLELVGSEEDGEFLVLRTGHSTINVYRSDYAGTNRATAASWVVGDELEDVVHTLKDKGVKFERYDMPNMIRDGDIYRAGDMKVAWFKDPDGNILNLASG
jgi:catechol 2,3-dioxygenase-like lactoylglutathione lyase family enzyme